MRRHHFVPRVNRIQRSQRRAHIDRHRMGSIVGAIGIKHDLFSQQLNDRIIEGKTKRSMWTSTHERNRTGGVRYSTCPGVCGSCILPADTWVHPLLSLLLQPPSWVLQTVISMICADMAARRVME